LSSHWSLLVVLNPGMVTVSLDENENDPFDVEVPAMLLLDSFSCIQKLKLPKTFASG
jgi:hypothetical protein